MIRVYEDPTITKLYVQYRPVYTDGLKEAVMRYCKEAAGVSNGAKFGLMVDVACGSGQANAAFQPHFEKIVGVDISENQLEEARQANKFDNISYMLGSAESIPVADKSVDLVISGTACHRFDLPNFYREVARILKPTGCVALFSYTPPIVTPLFMEDKVTREAVREKLTQRMDEYEKMPNDQRMNNHIADRYKTVHALLPSEKKRHIVDGGPVMSHDWSLEQLVGYYLSLAAYQEYAKIKRLELGDDEAAFVKHDRARLLRDYVRAECKVAAEVKDEDVKLRVDYPVFLVLGTDLKV